MALAYKPDSNLKIISMRLFSYLTSFGLFAVSSLASAQSIDYPALDRRINIMMQAPDMVGLSVAIVEGDEIKFAKGYGETLKGSGEKVDADTVFRWASISKSVAATLIYDLSEDDVLSTNDPIHPYAPSLELPPASRPTKIGDVLSHRIGLPSNAHDKRIEADWTGANVRRSLDELERKCGPGTCHAYQNAAFDSLSEVIEGVTKLPYKAVVNEKIFKPLDMTTASVTREGLVRSKNWARPHKDNGTPYDDVLPTYYRIPAAAGINSSVKDLAKWMSVHFKDHAFLSDKQRADMQTPYVNTPREKRFIDRYFYALEDPHYGLGWRIYDHAGRKLVGHRGGVMGYRSLTFFDPERRAGIAVMWNTAHTRPVALQLEFLDQLYGLERKDWLQLGGRDKG